MWITVWRWKIGKRSELHALNLIEVICILLCFACIWVSTCGPCEWSRTSPSSLCSCLLEKRFWCVVSNTALGKPHCCRWFQIGGKYSNLYQSASSFFSSDPTNDEVWWWLESYSRAYSHGCVFVCVGCNSKMDNYNIGTQNVAGDNSIVWVDQETFDVVFVFANKGSLDHASLLRWVPIRTKG